MGDLKKIRHMCNNIGVSGGKQSNEFLFTLDCVDLFYYNKNIGEIDIKTGFVDGNNDGGIDYIYADNDTMYLIQGKSTSMLSNDDIKNIFSKMIDTIENFNNKNYDKYSKILKQAYLNAYDDLNDEKNIELVLFTNAEIAKDRKNELNSYMMNNDRYANYTISIYDGTDIDDKETILFQDSDLIKEDKIDLYFNKKGKNNRLDYGENGTIVNVKASSVKRLFEKYGSSGLFSYNLREHINQASVDAKIEDTIKNEKDKFWFYNNGITIGCNDFLPDGNNIKLYDFSIINGAQTTTKIGESKYVTGKNDFALVCKIVRAKNNLKQDSNFISKISEASNSQKPIKQRDLKSNSIEQKRLQKGCAQNEKRCLAVEIKRGVKPKNYKKVEKWQRVTNEYIGQLIYACIYQHPGNARNSKNTMFQSKKLYKSLFGRKHDYDTLYDLVRLADIYTEYSNNLIRKIDDLDKIGIVKNGKLTVLAIVCFLIKKERGIINDSSSPELTQDNLNRLLITDYPYDDLEKRVGYLFDFIIRQLQFIYDRKKESMKITSYSNFFKNESIYEMVLYNFDNLDDYDEEKLADLMNVFTIKKE